jgi:hypothetical protein
MCYIWKPLKDLGQQSINDYKDLEVNHTKLYKQNCVDKSCNDQDFLEWVTRQENIEHSVKNNLGKSAKPILVYHINEKKQKGEFFKRFSTMKEVHNELQVSHSHIRNVVEGKSIPKKWWFEYEVRK